MATLVKQQVTRYLSAEGKAVPKGTPGARKVRKKSRFWYAQFALPGGKRERVSLGTPDKQEARRLMHELERKRRLQAHGIDDNFLEHAVAPLAGHVEDWLKALVDKGRSDRHRDLLRGRVERLAKLADWERLADVNLSSALGALAELGQQGRGVQTRNFYIQAVKQLLRWCVEDQRLQSNPLAGLKGENVNADRRHDRRDLTAEEQRWLFKVTEAGPVRSRLPGASRALLYRLAAATGFRAGELRSLVPASFDFDADPPTVTVQAAYSKHRRQDVQPLPPALAQRVKEWLAAGNPLWPRLTRYPSRMIQPDLVAARAAWIAEAEGDEAERKRREQSDFLAYRVEGPAGPVYADFHSLRHTFISAICRTDAPVKTLMEMARHGDPRLTLKTYAHARLADKAAVLAQLPEFEEARLPGQDGTGGTAAAG
jgi:integrase